MSIREMEEKQGGVNQSYNYQIVAMGGLYKYSPFNNFYLIAFGIKKF